MTNQEIQFRNNHQKALQFEEEILEMLKENNSIRESVAYLGEEIFLENEGEIMAFLRNKAEEEDDARKIYNGMVVAGITPTPAKSLNDSAINGEREPSGLSIQERWEIEEENERDFENTFGMDRF